ncbi:hypothetical protein WQE_04942 [Paraburkholderia hospita]|uniref:Uncharacterized protein n=1 Tax=Paraburkholderia hospita TaxID=169430 RepID=A0ABN0FTZ2_9BURK|nr:hypothetical protein [Paraburkholderia hospita]EIN02307.1 hypothetical protein WQE_04942 [Paraburkholderia hospita]
MTLVSQSEFARMCGVSRQAVLKWKSAGRLVLQGSQVDVEATDKRMQQYHDGGSPLRRTAVDTVDSRLTKPRAVDKTSGDLSTEALFRAIDGTQNFDFSRVGLEHRVTEAAGILGFDAQLNGDDIDLRRDGKSHFRCEGDSFDENAFCALDMLRWWLGAGSSIPAEFRAAIPLLARPFGTVATMNRCGA